MRLADLPGGQVTNPLEKYGDDPSQFGELLNNVFKVAVVGGGLLLTTYLIFGAFKYITSGGDPKATDSAKSIMTNAVIGIVIMATAFLIVQIIGLVLGVDFLKLEIPGP